MKMNKCLITLITCFIFVNTNAQKQLSIGPEFMFYNIQKPFIHHKYGSDFFEHGSYYGMKTGFKVEYKFSDKFSLSSSFNLGFDRLITNYNSQTIQKIMDIVYPGYEGIDTEFRFWIYVRDYPSFSVCGNSDLSLRNSLNYLRFTYGLSFTHYLPYSTKYTAYYPFEKDDWIHLPVDLHNYTNSRFDNNTSNNYRFIDPGLLLGIAYKRILWKQNFLESGFIFNYQPRFVSTATYKATSDSPVYFEGRILYSSTSFGFRIAYSFGIISQKHPGQQ